MIRLVAVDGATLARVGYAAALSGDSGIVLAGAAAGAVEARELIAQLEPDVVTVDAWLPDGDALALGADLRAERSRLGVLLLGPTEDELVFRALDAGLSGVVPRTSSIDLLIAAIRHAAVAPASFTTPDLVGALARRRARLATLSPRELEVLRFLDLGLSLPAIAAALRVTESTVRTYVTRLYQKLGASDRAQALALAAQQQLLPARP